MKLFPGSKLYGGRHPWGLLPGGDHIWKSLPILGILADDLLRVLLAQIFWSTSWSTGIGIHTIAAVCR